MAAFIVEQGHDVRRFALTRGHADHVLGSEAFAGCDVYAHALTPSVMERGLPAWTERSGLAEAHYRDRLAWPTVTFTDELWLDLGDVGVRMVPTPGHSEDGVSMWIPKHRTLVAGDAVTTGIVPAIGDGDSRTLQTSLYRLMTMEIDALIPGHGPTLHGVTRVREWLGWLATYIANIRTAATALMSTGAPAEDISPLIGYADHVGDRLSRDRHGMPRRHRATVDVIVTEVMRDGGHTPIGDARERTG
jgi:glyoxylase-like metal-dependent hydrolase (beta-lactamase superfamily II)